MRAGSATASRTATAAPLTSKPGISEAVTCHILVDRLTGQGYHESSIYDSNPESRRVRTGWDFTFEPGVVRYTWVVIILVGPHVCKVFPPRFVVPLIGGELRG